MQASDIAAAGATALAVVGALPQAVRLSRTRDGAGVSLTGAAIGVVTEAAWVAYTVHGKLWPATVMPVLMVIANATLAWLLSRIGFGVVRSAAFASGWTVLLVAAARLGSWQLLGALLAVAYAVQVAPCIYAAYRARVPSGIAPARWMFVLVESTLWGGYGVARHDRAIVTFAVVGVMAASAILLRCSRQWSVTPSNAGG